MLRLLLHYFSPKSLKKPTFTALMASSSSSSQWACSRCTFLNSPSNKSSCQVCLSPPLSLSSPSRSSSSSSSSTNWSCRACTFSNKLSSLSCEICGTQKQSKYSKPTPPFSAFSDFGVEPDELSDPSIGNVFLPLRRCGGGAGGRKRRAPSPEAVAEVTDLDSDNDDKILAKSKFKLMSYNVWFREDLELQMRMQALGNLIKQHSPDFICFQEVTPNIYNIFENSTWWKDYNCSVPRYLASERPYFCMLLSNLPVKSFKCKPFSNSIMGRELCIAEIQIGDAKTKTLTLTLATTHLESPCPAPPRWDQMYSKERVTQARESLNLLEGSSNVVFAGDMNWDDKLDGSYPLPAGGSWADAWSHLRPGEQGWTYDTKANQMLTGNRALQKRLDRVFFRFTDFDVVSVEMIGTEAIPGVTYSKDKKVKKEIKRLELPVLLSDHFGLLFTFARKE